MHRAWGQELTKSLLDPPPPHHMIALPSHACYKPAYAALAGWLGECLHDAAIHPYCDCTVLFSLLNFVFVIIYIENSAAEPYVNNA